MTTADLTITLVAIIAAALGGGLASAAINRSYFVTNPQLQQAIDQMRADEAAFHTAQANLLQAVQTQVSALRQTVADTLNRVPDPQEQATVLSAFSEVTAALESATTNANAAAAAIAAGQDITQGSAPTTQDTTQAPAPTDSTAASADVGSSTGGTPAGEGSATDGTTV